LQFVFEEVGLPQDLVEDLLEDLVARAAGKTAMA
jgi:hypothetical protein